MSDINASPNGVAGASQSTAPSAHPRSVDGVPAAIVAELAEMKRLFGAACAELGAVNEALGLDPDDGGADPIIDAIDELKAKASTIASQFALRALVAAGHVSQEKVDEALAIAADLPEPRDMDAAGRTVEVEKTFLSARMGRGAVAIGEFFSPEVGEPGIIFLSLDKPRAVGTDTSDAYPIGEPAPASKVLASVLFANPESVAQTIGVLTDIKEKHWPAAPATATQVSERSRRVGAAESSSIKAFEAWARKDGLPLDLAPGYPHYRHTTTLATLNAWNAALAYSGADTLRIEWIEDSAIDGVLTIGLEVDGGVHLTYDALGAETVSVRNKSNAREALDAVTCAKGAHGLAGAATKDQA